jgi:CRP/FNR family transcriptional regulator, cyclic AMP receptor protein
MTDIVSEGQIDKAALLRNSELFSGLEGDDVASLAAMCRVAVYPEHDEIIAEGADFDEETDGIFLIVDGQVEIRKDSTDGTDGKLLVTLGPGDFFGEMALLDGKPRSASVFATAETQCLVLHRWDFLRALRKSPEIAIRMLAVLSSRLRAMNETMGKPD